MFPQMRETELETLLSILVPDVWTGWKTCRKEGTGWGRKDGRGEEVKGRFNKILDKVWSF